jgi:hypothetical protein
MSSDRHAKAYAVLFDPRSDVIESRLPDSESKHRKAYEDARCLACHTTPRPSAELESTAWLNSDGVGCESCHGAAADYIGPHTTSGWDQLGVDAKRQQGLLNTKDLKVRAEICAGCHVGEHSADGSLVRDVNHDLIAAGHPRLAFEFSAYLENMPPHWDEKFGKAAGAGPGGSAENFAARAWAIGRLATIKAALSLLERRLPETENRAVEAEAPPEPIPGTNPAKHKATAPWPEFTEYSCFSCHHDLRDQAWRRVKRDNGAPIGSPRSGTWILCGTEELFASPAVERENQAAWKELVGLAVLMEKRAAIPEISKAVGKTSKSIDNCLRDVAKYTFDAKRIEDLIDQINDEKAWDHVASWDEAAQRYLALVPLYQSWLASTAPAAPTPKQDALHKQLCDLLERLEFPKGFDSPRGFEPGRFPSQGR